MKPDVTTLILVALTAMAVPTAGCTREPAPDAKPRPSAQGDAEEKPRAPADAKAAPSLSAEARASIDTTLGAYEQIRSKLASDEISAVAESAAALQRSATEAATNAPEALGAHLTSIAAAAGRLHETPKDDPDAVRKAFGEISRSTVALLAAEPSLREDLHVFECPMAQGYKKWVQRTDAAENPYMGQKMLECGSKADWAS